MATSYDNAVNFAVATAAAIQNWAGKIEALLTAAGWTQTTDTGQTAAASLPAATTTSQVCGYQIWEMADSLASSRPVFLKLEYGSGTTATYPQVWITIGSGSNGSGTLTGIVLARTSGANFAANATGLFMGSGSTNRLWFYIGGYSGGSQHHLFMIERTKDSTGADTTDGVVVLYDSNSSNSSAIVTYQLLRWSGNVPPNSTYYGAFLPSGTTWANGTNIGVCPLRFFDGQPSNPCISAAFYLTADIAANSQVSMNSYGTAHTYYTLGALRLSSLPGLTNPNGTAMLIWE